MIDLIRLFACARVASKIMCHNHDHTRHANGKLCMQLFDRAAEGIIYDMENQGFVLE
jgi:hypothetical protein